MQRENEIFTRLTMATYEEVLAKQGILVYTITGVSMMPLLRQRKDLVVIKPKPEDRLRRLDVPLFLRDNGQYVIHRVLWVRKNDYVMCGDNQWHPERGITDRHIIGILDAVIRDGVTYPLRSTPEHPHVSWKYLLYVHLWCDLYLLRAPIVYIIGKLKRKF